MPVRTEAVVGQQPQASRREKDKLEGTGLRKQCYILRYFLSESRIRGCACQWLSEWGSRLDRVFSGTAFQAVNEWKRGIFCTGAIPDRVMLLAKVLDIPKHWILLVCLLRLCFIFLFMCKNFPAAELVSSMENLSGLKNSVQLNKKLEGCEILRLRIVGYN